MLFLFTLLFGQLKLETPQEIPLPGSASVEGFALSDKGELCLFDGESSGLIFLSKSGTVIARRGGVGQGPGEFQYFAALAWLPQEKLFVTVDWGNQKLTTWQPDGRLVASYQTPMPMIGGDCAFLPGQLVFSDAVEGVMVAPVLQTFDYRTQIGRKVYERPMKPVSLPKLSSGGLFVPPWQARLLFCVAADVIVVGFGENPFLQVLDLAGQPLRRIKVAMKPFPVSEAHVKTALDELAPQDRSRVRGLLGAPDRWPLLSALRSDSNGRVWCFGAKVDGSPVQVKVIEVLGNVLAEGQVDRVPDLIWEGGLYYMKERGEQPHLVRQGFRLPK